MWFNFAGVRRRCVKLDFKVPDNKNIEKTCIIGIGLMINSAIE